MLVTQGLAYITEHLAGVDGPKWMQWGEGTTPVVLSDVALEEPRGESRVECVRSQESLVSQDDTAQMVATLFIEGVPGDITEVGLFLSDVGDTLFSRAVFSPISLGVEEGIQFTMRVRFANILL